MSSLQFPIRGYDFRSRSRPPMSLTEKLICAIAIGLLAFSVIGFSREQKRKIYDQPLPGGTYTEGVVADSPTKLERIVTRLTNIGLTYRETDGTIKPALAESWQVSEDKKVYTFKIHKDFAADGLLSTIQNSKNDWTNIQITNGEDNTLIFTLQEPLSLFLATTASPIFPYGPYEVVRRDKEEIILRANPNFVVAPPYIQKITIKAYQSQEQLVAAAENKEIDGSTDFDPAPNKLYQEYVVSLPRYHILFFNLTRPAFKKIEDRQRIINQTDGNPASYTLLTSQSGISSQLADDLAKELSAKKITLTVQKKNSVTLQKEEIQKREFDLLLYGINYANDRDYYPFWHSSQVNSPGLNLSGAKDKELDTLLETTRRENDAVKRSELNSQIEKYLADKALQKIMKQEEFRFWISSNIKGVEYGTIDEANDRFNLVWRWYMKSKKTSTPPN